MKKNVYVRSVLMRENRLKAAILSIFFSISSYPKLLLECLIRGKFGVRYFNLASAFMVAFIFAIIPVLGSFTGVIFHSSGNASSDSFLSKYLTWYCYLIAFVYCSYRHYQEQKHSPSVFDFNRYSKSSGDINELFFKIKLRGKEPSIRQVETLFEPALFLIIGILLWLIHQPLGIMLIICAVIYSLSYAAQYWEGDNFMMGLIDKKMINEGLEDVFVNDKDPKDAKGLSLRMKKPSRKDLREDMLKYFFEDGDDDDIPEVV